MNLVGARVDGGGCVRAAIRCRCRRVVAGTGRRRARAAARSVRARGPRGRSGAAADRGRGRGGRGAGRRGARARSAVDAPRDRRPTRCGRADAVDEGRLLADDRSARFIGAPARPRRRRTGGGSRSPSTTASCTSSTRPAARPSGPRSGSAADALASARASASVGCPAVPPAARVLSAPHAQPSASASVSPAPVSRAARKPASNESPAPVLSIGLDRRAPPTGDRPAAGDRQRALGAELDHDGRPPRGELARRRLDVAVCPPRQPQRLLRVRQQDVEGLERAPTSRSRGSQPGSSELVRARPAGDRSPARARPAGTARSTCTWRARASSSRGTSSARSSASAPSAVRIARSPGRARATLMPVGSAASRTALASTPALERLDHRACRARRRPRSPRSPPRRPSLAAPAAMIPPDPPSTSSAWSTNCSRWPKRRLELAAAQHEVGVDVADDEQVHQLAQARRQRVAVRRRAARRRPCGSCRGRASADAFGSSSAAW